MVELAHRPYHTVVIAGLTTWVAEYATVVGARLLAGTPANGTLGILPLDRAVVGPVPKPAKLSTRYPQVFIASVTGEAAVPLEALMVLPPPIIAVVVVEVIIDKV
jgi:hypothetical protein